MILKLFQSMGHMVRAMIAFGFAAFWGYCAWQWHEMGEFGPGRPTVIGTATFAMLAGLGGLASLLRAGFTATAPVATAQNTNKWDEEPRTDFDADAVIARHLAKRQASDAASPAPEAASETRAAPAAATFGRKRIM